MAARKKKAAKRGRPSIFTPELAATICSRIASGQSLRTVCEDPKMPPRRTVRRWIDEDTGGLTALYAQAREERYDLMAEEILAIADDSDGDTITDRKGNEKCDNEWVQRCRLRVDTRKWLLSKLAPRKYGDRLAVAGVEDAPLVTMSLEERARQLALLVATAASRRLAAPVDAPEVVNGNGNGHSNGNGSNGHG